MPIWQPRLWKPIQGATLNRAHPLASGIVFDVPYVEGAGTPCELITGQTGVIQGTAPTWQSSPYGPASYSPYATQGGYSWDAVNPPQITLMVIANSAYTGATYWFSRGYASGNIPWALTGGTGTEGGMWVYSGGFVSTDPSANPMPADNSWHTVIGTADGTNLNYYFDGVLSAQTAFAGALPSNTSPIYCGYGGYGGGVGNGAMALQRIWDHALTPQQILAITANPWQVYAQPFDWLIAAAGGGTVTGTGAVTLGGFTIAGTGGFTTPATGAVSLGTLTVAGTGGFATQGVGTVALGSITVAGTGGFTAPATGTVSLGAMTVSGSGGFTTTSTGSVALAGLTAAGSGTASIPGTASGSGAVTLAALTAAGTGGFGATASGSIALAHLSVAGTGTFAGIGGSTGSGVVTLGPLVAAGSVGFGTTASGSITLGSIIVTSAASGGGVGPLFLPYEFTTTLLPGYDSDPFGIDPGQTAPLPSAIDTDPFGIDPGQTASITVGLDTVVPVFLLENGGPFLLENGSLFILE